MKDCIASFSCPILSSWRINKGESVKKKPLAINTNLFDKNLKNTEKKITIIKCGGGFLNYSYFKTICSFL